MALTGFFAAGVCNDSLATAEVAFESMYPMHDTGFLYALSASTPVSPNVVQATVQAMSLAKNSTVTLTYNVPLTACDPALAPTWIASFDPAVAGSFFVWGFSGILIIGMMSWAIGKIMRMTYDILTKNGKGL